MRRLFQWADQDFHHISGLAQLGTVNGTTRDVIVIGIATIDRRNELALPTETPELIARYPTQGHSQRFRDFIRSEVQPWVAANYRTNGHEALMGESLAGLFVVGYVIFEVPGNMMLYKVGARRWIARIMMSWGLATAAMVFVNSEWQFYALRFVIGAEQWTLAHPEAIVEIQRGYVQAGSQVLYSPSKRPFTVAHKGKPVLDLFA